ncbi:MAG TPA: hypothetical protein VGF48_23305 [Thermoanaerobaculia bacterium]|jgi:hypothetical protein
MTHKVSIMFGGICSHFQRVVPGIPHRVVLPNATSVHFGLVRTQNGFVQTEKGPVPTETKQGSVGSYYLLPHFPVLLVPGVDRSEWPTVKGVIEGGVISSGARLEIVNALDREVTYDDSYYQFVRSIREFLPDYQFSNEVVLGERAAAYFDLFAGRVYGQPEDGGTGATTVVVEIHTDGPPALRVTPFGGLSSEIRHLTSPYLKVLNTDVDPPNEDASYDFLLHYLTSNRGMPQLLSGASAEVLPGLWVDDTGALPRTSHAKIAVALQGLAGTIANNGPTHDQVAAMSKPGFVLGPSCSDTRYP